MNLSLHNFWERIEELSTERPIFPDTSVKYLVWAVVGCSITVRKGRHAVFFCCRLGVVVERLFHVSCHQFDWNRFISCS